MARKETFLRMMQAYVADLSIVPASLRNQGAAGVVQTARDYMKNLPLGEFGKASGRRFTVLLDMHTEQLQSRLPKEARTWGAARKALNVFLRSAVMNVHLREAYRLERLERFLELPLDQQAAEFLKANDDSNTLPVWRGIKSLQANESAEYQSFAERLAARCAVKRVHLELYSRGAESIGADTRNFGQQRQYIARGID